MRTIVLPMVLLSLFAVQNNASAQCCTAGNPVNTNCAPTNNGENILNVTLSYMYSFSDSYYKGTQQLDKTYLESNYDYASLGFSYGISSKLRLTADLGYFFDKSQRFVNSDYSRYAQGISDGTLGLSYSSYATEDNLFEILQTARITIPLGEIDQVYDDVVLPIDLQPSSGNYRYNIGLIFAKRFAGSDFSLMSFSSVEFSQAIETRNTFHKYGNLYNASLMGIYRIAPSVQGLLQVRYEIRDRALNGTINNDPASSSKNNQYSFLNSSGGVIAYISPQVAVNFFDDWMLSLQYNYPFYKNIYGEEQLTNRHSISANLSRVVDFGGSNAAAALPDEDGTLSSVKVHIRGNCDMCKTRIETVAASQQFVHSAVWNPETEQLTVFYKDDAPDLDAIKKALAEAGHDSDSYTASNTVYDELPECCHYRAEK
ncbi:MAG: heavy-metal-associated domain-containing protein [Bacteroidota bacterium]